MTASAVKGGKLIALTFDDGPGGYTNGLLDGLAARNVKVTFFMVGANADCYPNTVRRAYNEGHQIAQHTYDHPALTTKTNEQIAWQLNTTDAILDRVLGQDLDYLIRTPYGDYNDRVLSQIGVPNILWSVDSCDWQLLNAEKVCNQIVSQAFDGAIVLVHDIHRTSIPGALNAIDILLDYGYEFVTVNELFRRRGETLQNGVNYYRCKPTGIDLGGLTEPSFEIKNGELAFTNIDPNGTLHYTIDGSAPTRHSPVYSTPLSLYNGTLRYSVIASGSQTPIRTFTVTENGNLFRDVLMTDWYFDEVDRTMTLGLFQGVAEYCFAPNDGLTRAMFVTVLYRLMQKQGKDTEVSDVNHFADVPQGWYQTAVSWAYEKEIVNGYDDGKFRPNSTITREEMCAILDRTLRYLGEETKTTELTFADSETISDWAKESVARVSAAGLILGQNDNTFAPRNTATRAQAATVLLRLYDMLGAK